MFVTSFGRHIEKAKDNRTRPGQRSLPVGCNRASIKKSVPTMRRSKEDPDHPTQTFSSAITNSGSPVYSAKSAASIEQSLIDANRMSFRRGFCTYNGYVRHPNHQRTHNIARSRDGLKACTDMSSASHDSRPLSRPWTLLGSRCGLACNLLRHHLRVAILQSVVCNLNIPLSKLI